MNYLYMIRHGETLCNAEGRIQGQGVNSPLSEKGIDQCHKLRSRLAKSGQKFDKIIASPSIRAVQTAEILFPDEKKRIELFPEIQEIFCGEIEGKLVKEIDPSLLQQLRENPNQKYPGGESCVDVRERALFFYESMRKWNDDSCIMISHGNFIRCFTSAATGLDPLLAMRMFLGNTGLCSLLLSSSGYSRITSWNDQSHIYDFPVRL